jgi:hypothetical protein
MRKSFDFSSDQQHATLARQLRPVLKNVAGRAVGEIRPAAGLRD